MSKKAMKLALEALECTEYPQDHYDAITALREALAEQPAEQEPVAKYMGKTYRCPIVNLYQDIPVGTLLYTTPAQRTWVGLTDEELKPLCAENHIVFGAYTVYFIRAIEAKLKEKNT